MSQPKSSNLKRNLALFFFSLLMLTTLLVLLSSHIARWFGTYYLAQHEVTAEIEQVDINWIDGQFALHGLSTQSSLADKRRLAVDKLSFSWSWQGVWSSQLSVSDIQIEGLRLDVISENNQLTMVGPINLASFQSDTPSQTTEQSPWSLAIDKIALKDFDVCYHQNNLPQCINWQLVQVDSQINLSSDAQPSITGALSIKALAVDELVSLQQASFDGLSLQNNQIKWSGIQLNVIKSINLAPKTTVDVDNLNLTAGTFNLTNHQVTIEQIAFSGNQVITPDNQLIVKQLQLQQVAIEQAQNQDLQISFASFALNETLLTFEQPNPLADIAVSKLSFNDLSANLANQTGALNQLQINQLQANTMFNQQSQPLAKIDNITIGKLAGDGQQLSGQLDALLVNHLQLWLLTDEQRYARLVDLQQLNLQQAQGSTSAQQFSGLTLQNIKLMEDLTKTDDTMLITADNIALSDLQHGDALEIKELLLNGLKSTLTFEQEKGLNVSRWLAKEEGTDEVNGEAKDEVKGELAAQEQAGEQVASVSSKDEPKSQPIQTQQPKPINIASLIINDSQIDISENTTGVFKQHQLSDIDLKIADIELNGNETASKKASMFVDLTAMINQSGTINAKGSVNQGGAGNNGLNVDVNGKINHLNLTEFSAYSAQHIGYRIDQGQLSSDIRIKINNDVIDSNFDLLLNKFNLNQLQQHEKNLAYKELGIPLASALNLLKDNDNNIALSIPVTGDLDNPKFSAADIISIVSLKAIKSAVLYTYSPLGLVSYANDLVNLATAMRFKPIEFDPTQTALTDQHQQRLTQTAKVLKDKSHVTLVLCANATYKDVLTQVDEAQAQADEAQTDETPVSTPVSIETLIGLANQRQQTVKNYLVTQHDIGQHRLLLCNVKLDKTPKSPKVAISL